MPDNEEKMMSAILSPIAYELGAGGIGGFIIGYIIKKVSKLLLFLIAVFIILLLYLGTSGIISIEYGQLWDALTGLSGFFGEAAAWLIGVISLLPFIGSFLAGFVLGFKFG